MTSVLARIDKELYEKLKRFAFGSLKDSLLISTRALDV